MNIYDCDKMVHHLNDIAQQQGNINVEAQALHINGQGWTVRIINHVSQEVTERWGELNHDRYRAMIYEMKNIEW